MFNLRRHFLPDPSVIFLNHGSFGATPRPVFRAYHRWGRELERQPVEFLGRRAADLMADARAALGATLGTAAVNLVYTQNVTKRTSGRRTNTKSVPKFGICRHNIASIAAIIKGKFKMRSRRFKLR